MTGMSPSGRLQIGCFSSLQAAKLIQKFDNQCLFVTKMVIFYTSFTFLIIKGKHENQINSIRPSGNLRGGSQQRTFEKPPSKGRRGMA